MVMKPATHKLIRRPLVSQAHYLQRHTLTPVKGILYRLFTHSLTHRHTHLHTHTLPHADAQVVREITVV